MNDLQKGSLDLEPLYTFFTEDSSPIAFAKLLDEFLYDYTTMFIKIQLSNCEDKSIHEHSDQFIYYIKLLRDILPECQK